MQALPPPLNQMNQNVFQQLLEIRRQQLMLEQHRSGRGAEDE